MRKLSLIVMISHLLSLYSCMEEVPPEEIPNDNIQKEG